MKKILAIVCCFFWVLLATACNIDAKQYNSPKGYDLNKPEKFNLPQSMLEVSGITFNNNNPDTIYAIQDEEGKLFKLNWKIKKQKHSRFGVNGDYEDVAILNETVFILKSNGQLFSFPLKQAWKEDIEHVKVYKKLIPKAEYEGLFANNASNQLYVLVKKSPGNKKQKLLTGEILTYEKTPDSLYKSGNFEIKPPTDKQLTVKAKERIKPTALSKHPITGEWYILTSANKLLILADVNWNITQVYQLNSSIFNQPEGITFDSKGTLYISNEGDELNEGNILRFEYRP
ncbi:SdiA-regulated domain-containing protein [Solitalea lacus]|uniref:SdiA-regulated domain-containing protein n=1 Tax=Solitalea lacus TaxID=2911172 RepID=UPI001EDB0009|nr:SdiA-regulated domain-containing protein [Solitalea lacus]UKJ06052.1 SdiA-regulated domain-containing protein [Solitalea lacus]